MDCPTLAMWLLEMVSYLTQDELTYVARGKLNKFSEIWETSMQFLESDHTDINELN